MVNGSEKYITTSERQMIFVPKALFQYDARGAIPDAESLSPRRKSQWIQHRRLCFNRKTRCAFEKDDKD